MKSFNLLVEGRALNLCGCAAHCAKHFGSGGCEPSGAAFSTKRFAKLPQVWMRQAAAFADRFGPGPALVDFQKEAVDVMPASTANLLRTHDMQILHKASTTVTCDGYVQHNRSLQLQTNTGEMSSARH